MIYYGEIMPNHEFGIMPTSPKAYELFETYEPEKYNCISINDDYIELIMAAINKIDCYWHTLQRPGKGLAYYGVTLIPPQSMADFVDIWECKKQEYYPLISLVKKAQEGGNFIIHFGI